MSLEKIIVKGAKEHNLKNIDVEIPREKLVVITGLSGSGKSSLAFDTIYAEGQRRYVESLSSYARMFLGQMDKPNVESIEGLSPAISIDQKTTSKNPRSTVGTVTEIYDYLRLLYARIGVPHCTVCGREIRQQTVDQIVDKIMAYPVGTKIQVMSPVVRGRKGEHAKVLDSARKAGFVRVRADGIVYDLQEKIPLEKNKKHNIEIIVDRLVIKPEISSRLSDSIETASKHSGGIVMVNFGDEDVIFSQKYACPDHGVSIDDLTPRMFSFNNPFGACPKCTGLGVFLKIDENKIIPDRNKSIKDGGIKGGGWAMEGSTIAAMYFDALARRYKFSLSTPIRDLPDDVVDKILYGTGDESLTLHRRSVYGSGTYEHPFEGVINNLDRRYRETSSNWIKDEIRTYMAEIPCDDCKGDRLSRESLAVTVGGINIADFCKKSVVDAIDFIQSLELSEKERIIGAEIIKEITERLNFLKSVGLGYLTLSRSAGTLSGGESQRIRLATQIGSSLMGVLYILDEPSIGLHQRDNEKLLGTLKRLRDLGNTVIVVEHDEETMYAADCIVDVGPGAGIHGGEIVCTGDVDKIKACGNSVTGQYLSGKRAVPVPEERRKGNGKFLEIRGAAENNLKNINVKIPLGELVCVTGVSGSGKSSLINEILYKTLARELNRAKTISGKHKELRGVENLDKVIEIDQSPIGRTPRSNAATYTGLFTDIRALFATTQDAKMRGFDQSRFSFNVKGGRCEACQGDGIIKIEMHFLSDVYVPCEVCKGKRYNRETLEVKYKGKSISDVLDMTVEEAMEFFANLPKLYRRLKTLYDVGLGYIKLGQPATTLSGGEAQRVKLATELSKRSTGRTIYILDEPTTGLHIADVHRLVDVLQMLVEGGNTVVVIEHNLDLIKTADHIIDLGPEGGDMGGQIIAQGTPEQVAQNPDSFTGQYLKPLLQE
ncbi:MAG: excinuclease ABC subunit UvrA [Ruminococcus sp.]|uniref:excinuclease ABC subunit UvrA n=1 Tax=Ruminococcus sp. JE7B6 TaxID=3233380 RepID=UPI00293178FB|nr:excinuclease ABC subunit UvrA [uncultured Ruminococcus sp.]MBQ1354184.1 excinuclease ABC subunit UvrA [Ruminococcus sp.]MBQ1586152.1 excinuclease ABC subunit UvrA [Ruminococcus sp.]MBQ1921120.1 excinuclease ABC subunit UvrA [Ruminococcus sp.]MBQ2428766.1 excinuclease ABC subunit UvrA [Ruminococcus sp.]MBQ2442405.1 excinuclease ABC subunit UvrA [Ruminococcus sp.]